MGAQDWHPTRLHVVYWERALSDCFVLGQTKPVSVPDKTNALSQGANIGKMRDKHWHKLMIHIGTSWWLKTSSTSPGTVDRSRANASREISHFTVRSTFLAVHHPNPKATNLFFEQIYLNSSQIRQSFNVFFAAVGCIYLFILHSTHTHTPRTPRGHYHLLAFSTAILWNNKKLTTRV